MTLPSGGRGPGKAKAAGGALASLPRQARPGEGSGGLLGRLLGRRGPPPASPPAHFTRGGGWPGWKREGCSSPPTGVLRSGWLLWRRDGLFTWQHPSGLLGAGGAGRGGGGSAQEPKAARAAGGGGWGGAAGPAAPAELPAAEHPFPVGGGSCPVQPEGPGRVWQDWTGILAGGASAPLPPRVCSPLRPAHQP